MDSLDIKTNSGTIKIIEPRDEIIKELQSTLPFGFFVFEKDFNGSKYGFVVRCGEKEIPCLKLQAIECHKSTALRLMNMQHFLIIDTYCRLKESFNDITYYATPYLKQKGEDSFESGIAHFIFSSNHCSNLGGNTQTYGAYDSIMGRGTTEIFTSFMKEYNSLINDNLKKLYIDIDIRTRSQLGAITSGFMLHKGKFLYHGTKIVEDDPRFNLLAKNGINEVIHIPSLPMTITETQLAFSKGQDK